MISALIGCAVLSLTTFTHWAGVGQEGEVWSGVRQCVLALVVCAAPGRAVAALGGGGPPASRGCP